jgi:hypothetical protein
MSQMAETDVLLDLVRAKEGLNCPRLRKMGRAKSDQREGNLAELGSDQLHVDVWSIPSKILLAYRSLFLSRCCQQPCHNRIATPGV